MRIESKDTPTCHLKLLTKLGSLITNPREWLLGLGLYVIRMRESNDVPHVIHVLSQV
jgi:hypothetical protein